jgi:hypothetical protein
MRCGFLGFRYATGRTPFLQLFLSLMLPERSDFVNGKDGTHSPFYGTKRIGGGRSADKV